MFPCRRDILDISSPLNDAAAALVDDSFLRCFKTLPDEPWNWNVYLYPLWAIGVVIRNCILFPLRCGWLAPKLLKQRAGKRSTGLPAAPRQELHAAHSAEKRSLFALP